MNDTDLADYLNSLPRTVSPEETARRTAWHDKDDYTPTERLGMPPEVMEAAA